MDLTKFYQEKSRLKYNPSHNISLIRSGVKAFVAFDDRFIEVANKLSEIISALDLPKIKLLDVGIGDGVYEKLLPKASLSNLDVFGLDLSRAQLERSKSIVKEGKIIDFDKNNIPYKDDYFNIVIVSEILEHLFYPKKVLLESLRVLKKNGYLILTYPNSGALQLRLSVFFRGSSPLLNYTENKEHIRFLNKKDILKMIGGRARVKYYSGLGSLLFDKWNFPLKLVMPRALQVMGNYLLPNLALGNLMLIQK